MNTVVKTRCETVDQIVRWDEVEEGDLVLHKGERELVVKVIEDVSQPAYVALRFGGQSAITWHLRNLETAVTRYIETTEAPGR